MSYYKLALLNIPVSHKFINSQQNRHYIKLWCPVEAHHIYSWMSRVADAEDIQGKKVFIISGLTHHDYNWNPFLPPPSLPTEAV